MPVYKIQRVGYEYICLSVDRKPSQDIMQGAKLTELDTGVRYIWYEDSWVEDLTLSYAFSLALKSQ